MLIHTVRVEPSSPWTKKKAFDRVEWVYLQRVLRTMNFGDGFCQWVALLYHQIFSAVLVNGELSTQFRVSRGVRQGCLLSPLFYVVMAETISCAVRNNPQIDGYPLPRTRRAKICQYADDTTIVVLSDASLKEVFSVFQRYELASGARLNVTKSHGLLIGSWKGRTDLPVHLDWSSSHITVIGSRLSNDGTEGWDKSLRSLDSMLASWYSRSLSYHGRALIANTLGLSRFWYLSSIACLPSAILQAINTRIFSFIWNQKREWLAHSSITPRSSQGGLSLIDVQRKVQSLHVLWIRRLVTSETLPWAHFFRRNLAVAFSRASLHQILLLPSAPKYALEALPPFYRSVMTSWFSLERRLENDEIVIAGPGSSSCILHSLSASFACRTFSASQRTQHRCVAKFQSLRFQVNWQRVWRGLHLWPFVRPVRDTSWLIAHGILHTADRLIRFGMKVNPLCHCGEAESMIHLFVECSFARQVLSWYLDLARHHLPTAAPPTRQEILLGFARDSKFPPVFQCLHRATRAVENPQCCLVG